MKLFIAAILILQFFLTPTFVLAAEGTEADFKRVALDIKEYFAKHINEQDASAKAKQRDVAQFKFWIAELKVLELSDPRSVWMDDAQYIIRTLYVALDEREEEKREIEHLLQMYPNFQIEDWTKENLKILIPSNVSVAQEMQALCFIYLDLKEFNKVRVIAENGIKRFPEEAANFKNILAIESHTKE